MSNAKKMSESNYEVIGGEEDYEILPTGFEDTRYRRLELFRNGGKFAPSEHIPEILQPIEKPVETNKKAKRSPNLFKCWSFTKAKPKQYRIKEPTVSTLPRDPSNGELNYETFRTSKVEPKCIQDSPIEPNLSYLHNYREISPFLQNPVEVKSINRNVIPNLPEPVKSINRNVIPNLPVKPVKPPMAPMRRTISYSAVHSHKYPILAPQFQDMIPEAPKRVQSSRTKKVGNKKEIKEKPNSEENYPIDIIAPFEHPKSPTNCKPAKIALPKFIPENNSPPKTPPKKLQRLASTPSEDIHSAHTKNIPKDRSYSTRKAPDVPVKPKHPKDETETPKEIYKEKSTMGESKEKNIQDLENHLKQFNIISSIDSNSQFRKLNYYQQSPSKEVDGLEQITS